MSLFDSVKEAKKFLKYERKQTKLINKCKVLEQELRKYYTENSDIRNGFDFNCMMMKEFFYETNKGNVINTYKDYKYYLKNCLGGIK